MNRILREYVEWKRALLRAIPGKSGEEFRRRFYGFNCQRDSRVLSGVTVYHPEKLTIGRRSGISSGCQINAAGGVMIGNDVLIGPGTYIWSQNHRYDDLNEVIRDQGYVYSEVVIENDVWIAARCVILPGVRISNGCVIAAGAVVTKSTDERAILAGVPAKQIGIRSAQNSRQDSV